MDEEIRGAYERVIRLLARRAHSRAELIQKLTLRGLDRGIAERAVEEARRRGYVDDADFALQFARRARDEQGWAPLRARQELRQRGVPAEDVEAAVGAEYGEVDLLELAVKLARKRAGMLHGDREAVRRRLVDYLFRRGYPTDVCRAAVDDVAPL